MAVDLDAWWLTVPEDTGADLLAHRNDQVLPTHLVRLLTQAGLFPIYGAGFTGSGAELSTTLSGELQEFLDHKAAAREV